MSMLVADFSGYNATAIGPPLRAAGFAGVIGQPLGNPRYAAQVSSAQAAGLEVLAAYAFAAPGDGAALCDALLGALVGPELRVVIDAEVAGITPDEVLAFGARARQWNPTVRPILYGSTSYIAANYAATPTIAALFDCWCAEYHADLAPTNLPPAPAPFTSWIGWQYSDAYPVPGLGAVDASTFTGDGPDMLSDDDKALLGQWMQQQSADVLRVLVGDGMSTYTNVLGQWISGSRDQTIAAVKAGVPAPAVDVTALAKALAGELGPELGGQLVTALADQLAKP